MSIPGAGNPLLLGGAGGYKIERSLRFNSADSAYLSRTPASAGNRKTWTWSGWVKRSALVTGGRQSLFSSTGATDPDWCEFGFEDGLFYITTLSTTNSSASVFRDPSAWFHLVVAFDTTLATASDRAIIWINNTRIPITINIFSSNTDYGINRTSAHYIGNSTFASRYFSGYLADIHFIDGQALTPSSFGETDINGVWQPKAYSGSYGTNGFQLKFADNSAATATTLGKDTSGNGNNWTPNNLSVSAGAGNDSLVDTPTSYGTDTGAGGEVRGNYATLNPLDRNSSGNLSNGNLDWDEGSATFANVRATIFPTSGKWYWEVTAPTITSGTGSVQIGLASGAATLTGNPSTDANSYVYVRDGSIYKAGVSQSPSNSGYSSGDIIGIAFDRDNNSVTFYKNGTLQTTGITGLPANLAPFICLYGPEVSGASTINFGQRPFAYTAPSGFKALCTQNLPAPTITKPSTVMDVKLYTGNGSTQTISGLGFSPDLVWGKNRNGTYSPTVQDTVRGAGKTILYTNQTIIENNFGEDWISAFNSDGFTMPNGYYNESARTYVAWCWDAGSSTVTNTSGTISSQVRANASAGFSIVTYTGNATLNASVGHGLGISPTLIIVKNRSSAENWPVFTTVIDGTYDYLYLNSTATKGNAGATAPSSTVFYLSSGGEDNGSGSNMVAYCFAPVAGYSAFGSYIGNGNADGPFVYTGFRPRWVLIKNTGYAGQSWWILDTARDDYNVTDNYLQANNANAEGTFTVGDILSNGFKIRTTDFALNRSGDSIIFAAFAEAPFALARAR